MHFHMKSLIFGWQYSGTMKLILTKFPSWHHQCCHICYYYHYRSYNRHIKVQHKCSSKSIAHAWNCQTKQCWMQCLCCHFRTL